MGSLMPGWDSLPKSTKSRKRSTSSLTKDEIKAYWRHKRQEMEAISKEKNAQNANALPILSETKFTTTMVAPYGKTTQKVVIEWPKIGPQPTECSLDWWTRSDWAYLNAPLEILDYPGQWRRGPYIRHLDVNTQYNRAISSPL